MNSLSHLPAAANGTEKPNARTEAALQRLVKAMHDIEAEIVAHHGIYPFNHGRVTQSELCRRADVKKATLQNPLHKDTTRVHIMAWLETVGAQLAQNRDGTRARVTVVADHLEAEVERLTLANRELQQQLAGLQHVCTQLQEENRVLKARAQP
jgi:hypothetical protein